MNSIQALILAIVQGLSEFLPISSSGHLALIYHIFKITEPPATYTVLVHFSTLFAPIIFFRHQFLALIRNAFRQIVITIIWASLPAFTVGFLLAPAIDQILSSTRIAAFGFAATSILLLLSRNFTKGSKKIEQLSSRESLLIGIFQAAAIMPGLSRSGATIIAGQWLNLGFSPALSFSFLLFIPAACGALALTAVSHNLTSLPPINLLIGLIVPGLVGYFSLVILQRLFLKKKLYFFAPYCAILAFISLISL